jgi:two-component system KDP operon response regulator KdpE
MIPERLILVIDDDMRTTRLMRLNLEVEGFRVVEAQNGRDALDYVRLAPPDLMILDLNLGEMDGFETLKLVREISSAPVIIASVRDHVDDKVRGLSLGADDYVTKPFNPAELTARVKSVLRRWQMTNATIQGHVRVDPRLAIDFTGQELVVEGSRQKLRATESRLLYHLVNEAGNVVPHQALLSKIWGYYHPDLLHTLRTYINYLRLKIEPDPAEPRYIRTHKGVGYEFIAFNGRNGGAKRA